MNSYEAMYYFLTLLSLTLVCGFLGVWWAGRGIRNKLSNGSLICCCVLDRSSFLQALSHAVPWLAAKPMERGSLCANQLDHLWALCGRFHSL